MRIIAGKARRLPLKSLPGLEVRPTQDRIKETLFNILSPEIEGSYFLDLCAGTGQIGLEAASRGSACSVFVDHSRKACDVIARNIEFTRLDRQCRLMCADCAGAIRMLEGDCEFDIIFMDPPYGEGIERGILASLSGSPIVKAEALIVVEADLSTDFSYADGLGFSVIREKRYKTNRHVFLAKKGSRRASS